tara:strand:- start:712 stop:1719 length:1008 start_codon:yes stop_codon:yes gene_type:complete
MKQIAVTTLAAYLDDEITSMPNLVTVGDLDSGSITANFGAIDNGTSGIRSNTVTVETSLLPDASGGADIGSTSAEFGDVYIADDKYINFGSDQNVLVGYDEDGDDSLEIRQNVEGSPLAITFKADQGDDNADQWKLNFADGGTVTFQSKTSGSYATKQTLDTAGNLTVTGEVDAASLDISGNADIDGTLEADAITVDGTALDEFIADTVGAMVGSNTETGISVTYDDSDNTLDFVIGSQSIVNSMLADDAVGADELASNAVVNASVASGAAIAFSKMEDLTASRALVSDANGDVSVSAVTSTEIGYVDGVTSNIQTQLDTKASTGKAIAMAMVFG